MEGKIYLEDEIVFKEHPKHGHFKDKTRARFGALTVLGFSGMSKGRASIWICRCDCGNIKKVTGGSLESGNTSSCGCQRTAKITTHGHTIKAKRTPEYSTWQSMLNRVRNPNSSNYTDYGGRGIRVCERWEKFENFLEDMGDRPSKKHSIDRIDFNGNYEPNNCRWATREEQDNNKRNNRLVHYNGKTQNITQWEVELGLNKNTIANRLRIGWSFEKAITTPIGLSNSARQKKVPRINHEIPGK